MKAFETKEVLFSLNGINKAYNQPILRNINFDIFNLTRPDVNNQGQIVSLVGKSGCGKSTLFRLMAGIEKSDSGLIKLSDNANKLVPVAEGNVGVVFQNSYVYEWRKVKKILSMASAKNKTPNWDSKNAIAYYAQILDIEDHLEKFAKQLSGGQRQRVAIAEQILNGGDFILMDEPFSGLDSLTIDKVTQTLSKLVLEGDKKTVILISHDLSNSLAISDTAFILAKEKDTLGATITNKICLASMGLAWQPEIKENPEFRNLLSYVKNQL